MAATPRTATIMIVGTVAFGLLTFVAGVLVGVSVIGHSSPAPVVPMAVGAMPPPPGTAVGVAKAPAAAPALAVAQAVAKAPEAAAKSVVAAISGGPPAAATTGSAPAAGAAVVAGAAAPEAAAPAPAAPIPVVTGLRSGLPLDLVPPSPLRGRLAAAAAALSLVAPAAASPGPAGQAPAAPPAAAPEPTAPGVVFAVQVGSFLLRENAERLAATLTLKGYAPVVLESKDAGRPVWFPVTLGPMDDALAAERLARVFTGAEGLRAQVVSWGPPAK